MQELKLAVLFAGWAMITPYFPWYINIPLGIALISWVLWSLREPKYLILASIQQTMPQLSIKRLGIAFIIIIFAVLSVNFGYSYFMRDVQETPTLLPEWQWSHPSPQEIFKSINALPPSLQDEARQNHEGIPVEWGVRLYSISETIEGARIHTYSLEDDPKLIVFTLDVGIYPQLNIMELGQQIVVKGIITEVNTIYIELDNCQLFFNR